MLYASARNHALKNDYSATLEKIIPTWPKGLPLPDITPAMDAVMAFMAATSVLPRAQRTFQRRKFIGMLGHRTSYLFFIDTELQGTGPTYSFKWCAVHPTRQYLHWISALRAWDFDFDIEKRPRL